ncbi:cytochrome P450 [Actinomadura chokoriensis]|uniref:cytochrome P450 n=1 Tax=Actinomadura chokoriensis TaxID=454156 RepID=UPI0031F7A31A
MADTADADTDTGRADTGGADTGSDGLAGAAPSGPELRFPPQVPPGPDPAREYVRLRERGSLARVRLPDGRPAWLASRYADNHRLLADERISRAAAAREGAPRVRGIALEAGSITTLDPPEHTRLRRLVAGEFTAHRMRRFRPRIAAIAGELADAMAAAGPPADLVARYAAPLPIRVICVLLGVPEPDHDRFRSWADDYLGTTGTDPETVRRAAERLRGYFGSLVAARRADPGDDLISALVTAREEDRLTEQELVALGVTLLVAGYQTAAGLIAGSVQTLLDRPGRLAELRADPELMPAAVEELLRYVAVSASGGTIRVATGDLDLGGTRVRAGEAVLPALTSANRDAAVFTDPDRLDLRRDPNPHLAFGHGAHRCLGAALARAELAVALGTLLERFPGLRHAEPGRPPEWRTGAMIRGPLALPVAW